RGADLDFANIDGQVTIQGAYSGQADFHNLSKPVHFTNSYSEFSAEKIPGEVRVSIGDINGTNLSGPVHISANRNKDVRLTDVSGSIDVSLERGDIEISESQQPLPKIDARTRFGEIDLAIPAGAKFDLNASSRIGEVENDYGSPLS